MNDPATWKRMKKSPVQQLRRRSLGRSMNATVTAGFTCAPEIRPAIRPQNHIEIAMADGLAPVEIWVKVSRKVHTISRRIANKLAEKVLIYGFYLFL